MDKRFDITYYNLYLLSNKEWQEIEAIFNLTSYKYKFNFTKQERKLIYRLKNNFLKGFKYSYNFEYMQDIKDNIKTLENQLNDLNNDFIYLNDIFMLNKELYLKQGLASEYLDLLDKKQELEQQIDYLKQLESNLISSKDKKTTLNDYLNNFKYIE